MRMRLLDARDGMASAAVWLIPSVMALACIVPLGTLGHQSPIDYSWQAVLHDAFLRERRFGVDVVFTMGPWGFLFGGYHPETRAIVLVAWTFIALALAFGTVVLTRALKNRWARLGMALSVMGALAVAGTDVRLFTLPALALALHFTGDDTRMRRAALVVVAVAIALASLVKFSVTVLAIGIVAILLLDAIVRRKLPIVPFVFAVAFAVLDLLAGQRLADLPAWIRQSMIVATSYHEMSAQPTGIEHPLWMYGVSAVAVLGGIIAALAGRLRWIAIAPVGGVALLLALLAKSSYVRHDAYHHVTAPMTLLVVALLFTPAVAGTSTRVRLVWGAALCASLWSGWMASLADTRAHLPHAIASKVLADARRLASAGPVERELAASYDMRLAETRLRFAVPSNAGSLDVYTTQQEIAAAHGALLATRPVFQSYVAHDRRLARLNRDWLAGERAPESILLRFETIDGRLPLLEDSLSWPELLARYDVRESGPKMAILSRRTPPRSVTISRLGEETLEVGKPFAAPPASILWAEIEVEPTRRGRMADLFRAAPPLWLRLTLSDGRERSFRFMRSVGSGGFILSPLVEEHPDYVALAAGRGGELPAVTSVVVTTGSADSDAEFYQSALIVRFSSLVISD